MVFICTLFSNKPDTPANCQYITSRIIPIKHFKNTVGCSSVVSCPHRETRQNIINSIEDEIIYGDWESIANEWKKDCLDTRKQCTVIAERNRRLRDYILANIREMALDAKAATDRREHQICFKDTLDNGEKDYPAKGDCGYVAEVKDDGTIILVVSADNCDDNSADFEIELTLDEFIEQVDIFVCR